MYRVEGLLMMFVHIINQTLVSAHGTGGKIRAFSSSFSMIAAYIFSCPDSRPLGKQTHNEAGNPYRADHFHETAGNGAERQTTHKAGCKPVHDRRHNNAENGVNDQIDQNIESSGALFGTALFCESKAPSVRGNKKAIRKAIK